MILETAVASRKGREGRNAEGLFPEKQAEAPFTPQVKW